MSLRGALTLLVLGSCQFSGSGGGGVDPSDARALDAFVIPDCTSWTPASAYFDPCAIEQPGSPLTLDNEEFLFDTTVGELTDASGIVVAHAGAALDPDPAAPYVISAKRFAITATAVLRATGDRPLIIASWSDIIIAGTLDAGSDAVAAGAGALAGAGDCVVATAGTSDLAGGGGGGGGGFQGLGGGGGVGNNGTTPAGAGGQTLAAPTIMRGGCSGALGGAGNSTGPLIEDNALAGTGGGSIALVAFARVEVVGFVRAGGQGGGQATDGDGGGGGAGSGGLIALDGAALSASGQLIASGGGGGAGADDSDIGTAGDDGRGVARATGGVAMGGGRDGGAGSGDALVDGLDGLDADTGNSDGGGGGGGGAGYILVWGAALMGSPTAAPAPTSMSMSMSMSQAQGQTNQRLR